MTLPSDLRTDPFYLLPWTPAVAGFSPSLITCLLSACSFNNASLMKAWTVRRLLTAPKIAPGTSDWQIGSTSTECTDLASEKWNGAHGLIFSWCIQPASRHLLLVWFSVKGQCPGRFTSAGWLFSTSFKKSTRYKKIRAGAVPVSIPDRSVPLCLLQIHICISFLFIHPAFLYANISKFTYICSQPNLSYIKLPHCLHYFPPVSCTWQCTRTSSYIRM